MSKWYVYNDFGVKKDVTELIGDSVRECVFASCVEYDGVDINFNYSGTLPEEAVILKLLSFGVDPETNNLTEAEITSYLALNDFAIQFFYLDSEIYVTNGKHNYLSFVKGGIGKIDVYPSKKDLGYFMRSSKPINNVIHCKTMKEFNAIIPKDENTIYVVEEEDYAAPKALYAETAKEADWAYEADIASYAEDGDDETIKTQLARLPKRIYEYNDNDWNDLTVNVGVTEFDVSNYINKKGFFKVIVRQGAFFNTIELIAMNNAWGLLDYTGKTYFTVMITDGVITITGDSAYILAVDYYEVK